MGQPDGRGVSRSVANRNYSRAPLGFFGDATSSKFASLAYAMNLKTQVDQGGVDVLWNGDSINAGGNATDMVTGSPGFHLMRLLQAEYNPAGVAGGWGWVPVTKTSGANWISPVVGAIPQYGPSPSTRWELANVATVPPGDYDQAPGRQMVRLGGGNPTATAAFTAPLGTTSLGVTYTQYSGGGAIAWEVTQAGVPFASGSLDGVGTTVYGKQIILATDLDPTKQTRLEIASPLSGQFDLSGALVFAGDERCGVRFAHMANWGSRLSGTDDLGIVKPTNNPNQTTLLQANVNSFTGAPAHSGTALGMTRAKVAFANYATNDATAATSSPTIFQSAVRAYNAYFASTMGIPLIWTIVPSQAGQEVNYAAYANIVVEEAVATPGVLAFSFWDAMGRPAHGGNFPGEAMHDRGYFADSVHYAGNFQSNYAKYLFKCFQWLMDVQRSQGKVY